MHLLKLKSFLRDVYSCRTKNLIKFTSNVLLITENAVFIPKILIESNKFCFSFKEKKVTVSRILFDLKMKMSLIPKILIGPQK